MSNGKYVKLVGTTNRHENWTTEYVVERDEKTGEVTKSVRLNEPVQLSADDRKKLEGLGAVFEDSSADEAKEFEGQRETQPQVGADVAAAAPLLGDSSGTPNQHDQS